MEERYVCKIVKKDRAAYGEAPCQLYGYVVEYVYLDGDVYRGMTIRTGCEKLDGSTYTNEYVVYHGLRTLLSWLLGMGVQEKEVVISTDSLRVVNQIGPKATRIVATNDYADIAKQCKKLAALFPLLKMGKVGIESLHVADQATMKC